MDIVIHNYLTGFALSIALIIAIAAPAATIQLWHLVITRRHARAYTAHARSMARAEYLRVMRHPKADHRDKMVVTLTWEAWCLLRDPTPDEVRKYVRYRMY